MSRVGTLVPVDVLNALVLSADFAEFHSRRVAAPPSLVDRAIRLVTLREMPLVKVLFALRSVPDRLAGRRGLPTSDRLPLLDQMLGGGFMLLADDPSQEIVIGTIARVKGRRNRDEGKPKADEFAGFDQPGFVKIAMNFHLVDLGSSTRLETATRVAATDAAGRRAFTAYWLLIRPWSGLIRRFWLRAIDRRSTNDAKL